MYQEIFGNINEEIVYEFNHMPSKYIHDTWWKYIKNGRHLQLLNNNSRLNKKISDIILSSFNIKDIFFHQFDEYPEKIALLPYNKIHETALYIGLIKSGSQINCTITKEHINFYKKNLGEAAYMFALNIAPEMRNKLNIKQEYQTQKPNHLTSYIRKTGLHILTAALLADNNSLKPRVMIKLGIFSKQYFQKNIKDNLELPDIESSRKIITSFINYKYSEIHQ